jgi:AcrR family transcriptional regulator
MRGVDPLIIDDLLGSDAQSPHPKEIIMPHDTFHNLSAEKRARIVKSAIDEFLGASYEKTSIDRIVKGAGIPKGSFYQYFDNKDDLYVYCIMDLMSALLAQSASSRRKELLKTIFERTAKNGLTATILAGREEQIALIGEKNFRFCQGVIDAPQALRNEVFLRIAKELIKPAIKEELARDTSINPDIDLDYFAHMLSLAEFVSIQYGTDSPQKIAQLNQHAYEYILAIHSFISGDGTPRDAAD